MIYLREPRKTFYPFYGSPIQNLGNYRTFVLLKSKLLVSKLKVAVINLFQFECISNITVCSKFHF